MTTHGDPTDGTDAPTKPEGKHGQDYVYCDLCGHCIRFEPGIRYVLTSHQDIVDACGNSVQRGLGEYICMACWDSIMGGGDGPQF